MATIQKAKSLLSRKSSSSSTPRKKSAITDIGLLSRRPDPMLSNQWYVKVMPPSAAKYKIDHTYVETLDLPFNEIKSGAHFSGGGYTYFPEFHDISAFNVNVYADVEGRAIKWLVDWRKRVKDFDSGLYGLPGDYKEHLVAALMTPTQKTIFTVDLQGIWPTSISNLSLENEGATKLVYAVNFSIDSQSIQIT